MKFKNIHTLDWYDNILKAFCTDDNRITYYCTMLALMPRVNDKIYLCTEIRYLKGHRQLERIIKSNTLKENWNALSSLIDLKKTNELFLIRTNDLNNDQLQVARYQAKFNLLKGIIWSEFPDVLDEAAKIDNWWSYFE